jgi:hypothetical protein
MTVTHKATRHTSYNLSSQGLKNIPDQIMPENIIQLLVT